MSAKFEQVKNFYDMRVWSETKLRNAVVKGWITQDEFEAITGKNYQRKIQDWEFLTGLRFIF